MDTRTDSHTFPLLGLLSEPKMSPVGQMTSDSDIEDGECSYHDYDDDTD